MPLFVIDTHLCVPRRERDTITRLREKYRRPNPKYQSAQRMGYATRGIPPWIELAVEDNGVVRFPREAVHELPKGVRIENRTSLGQAVDLGRPIRLRDYQVDPVDRTLAELERFHGGVLQSAAGSGKTVMALEIARRLGRKTLVLVHTSFLMTQWRDRIQQFLGVSAGTIQQDVIDTDHPIVLAMIQTVINRDLPEHLVEQFGLVISDEVHRISADTWRESIVRFPATYRLGISATPKRQDGLEWVFQAHIGPVVVVGESVLDEPEIYLVPTPVGRIPAPTNRMGKPDFVATVSLLSEHDRRNQQIAGYIQEAVGKNRKIIVFSDRRAHLEDLAKRFERDCEKRGIEADYGFFVGGMSEAGRAAASERQVIFSTFQFAREGLDVAALDTCMLVTPKSTVIQAVGRIQRALPGKPHPVVLDFVDDGIGVCRGLARRRLRQYRAQGWTVHDWRD